MPNERTVSSNPGPRRRWLSRGDAVIAAHGAAIAVVIIVTLVATGWWMLHNQRQALVRARAEQVRGAAALIAGGAESMLAEDQLTSVRWLVAEAGQKYQLTRCRIVLPDGAVLADQTPSQITLNKPPQSWPGGACIAADDQADDVLAITTPLLVRGRGNARLEIAASVAPASDIASQTRVGLAAAGALAVLGIGITYRSLRRKFRAIGAVRSALLAVAHGETANEALTVATSLGTEAGVWNKLLEEREAIRKQAIEARVGESAAPVRRGGTDLDAACDVLAQGLIIVDEHMKARYANGAAAAFLGVKREDLAGADVTPFLADNGVAEALRATVSGASRRPTVLEVKRGGDSGDTGVLRFAVRPVRKGDSGAAVLLIEDVTQARVVEQTRDAFLAAATHELRTPLTNIRLYVESALDNGEDAVNRAKALNVINQEARRLERIVTDMLSVAEIEAGSMQVHKSDVRLDAVFEELQQDYAAQAGDRKIELQFKLPPKLPVMQGDRDKLSLALHNLLSNALKYTPEGGRVTVDVDAGQTDLSVAVHDSGIGISEEDLGRLFQKFYRAKDPRVSKIKGTGLGLALAREVIRLHGGDINVVSQKDKGSTFTITLPLANAA